MARSNLSRVAYRRRREHKTNYRRREKLLLSGLPRAVVRKSLGNMQVQIIEYDMEGDRIRVSAHSRELLKLGWKFGRGNIPAAYLTGLLAGAKAKNAGITRTVPDFGLQVVKAGNRLYAAVKGIMDAGIDIPVSPEVIPSEDRLSGKHVAGHLKQAAGIDASISETKKKILEGRK
ncbi:50S ribosomal protein L18 [Candidatus Woesearchaeota archaeon]|nr:50S ribosomal protein L18 [Candidatus Woesearchaeota archaeon]